jgi:hypothetical protein
LTAHLSKEPFIYAYLGHLV